MLAVALFRRFGLRTPGLQDRFGGIAPLLARVIGVVVRRRIFLLVAITLQHCDQTVADQKTDARRSSTPGYRTFLELLSPIECFFHCLHLIATDSFISVTVCEIESRASSRRR